MTPLSCTASSVLTVDLVCPLQFISGGRRSRAYAARPARGEQQEAGDTSVEVRGTGRRGWQARGEGDGGVGGGGAYFS